MTNIGFYSNVPVRCTWSGDGSSERGTTIRPLCERANRGHGHTMGGCVSCEGRPRMLPHDSIDRRTSHPEHRLGAFRDRDVLVPVAVKPDHVDQISPRIPAHDRTAAPDGRHPRHEPTARRPGGPETTREELAEDGRGRATALALALVALRATLVALRAPGSQDGRRRRLVSTISGGRWKGRKGRRGRTRRWGTRRRRLLPRPSLCLSLGLGDLLRRLLFEDQLVGEDDGRNDDAADENVWQRNGHDFLLSILHDFASKCLRSQTNRGPPNVAMDRSRA